MSPFRRATAPLALALVFSATASAQNWETAANRPGAPEYVQLDYIVAFVSNQGESDPVTETAPHFGVDVLSAGNPAPQGPGGGLFALLPNGDVRKLFPLPAHEAVPGLIDTPLGQLERGAVVEPNMSEDGKTIYFTYFHDASWEPDNGGWQSLKVSYKGSDLYRLDVTALLADNATDPSTLPIRRLTTKRYTGPPKTDVQQTYADRFRQAVNLSLPENDALGYWGTMDMHMIEMRTQSGLKAVWVSNRTRTGNSNTWLGDGNHNFNLYIADILPDGSLGTPQQWQYYTTTSALSPIPLRNGLAFSYQSSTSEFRRWDIQWLDSEGRWIPLIGYAHKSELFHLGTFIVDEDGQDWFIGQKYYNLNDGGFGNLHKVRTADAGVNEFLNGPFAQRPRQLSEVLTVGAVAEDMPSPQIEVGGQMRYIGKFACPRAGRVGGEYLMSYTPTSANRWLVDADGEKGRFESHIVYRPNLTPFEPYEEVDPAQGKGLYTVIRDATAQYDLLWPTPVLSWEERTGMAQQEVAPAIADPNSPIQPGLPLAQVGTSAIYNTDIRPYDCYLENTGKPYNPNALSNNEEAHTERSFEGLTVVKDPNDFCRYLRPEDVLGIAVNLTSSRVDLNALSTLGYETDGDKRKETLELLGVYSTLDENTSDQSFLAQIPSDVPFEFHLLDKDYGMKLVDVRSWHSLKPREERTDCGGCHQHEAGFGIPFEGTEASRKLAMNMAETTRWVRYDEDCKPEIAVSSAPTKATPEWTTDIWPGFDQHCGGCHDASVSSDTAALAAFDYVDEKSAYDTMKLRNYASSEQGALGSPIFWAAYGERTDGRNNSLPEYQPNYPAGNWGFFFSDVHASTPGLCSASNPTWAQWVADLGLWIDKHMPRDTGNSAYGAQFDRFAPTMDFALLPGRVRIGYWDNNDSVSIQAKLNGVPIFSLAAVPNGSYDVPVNGKLRPSDRIRITVTDAAGNRQFKEKSVRELIGERRRGTPQKGARPQGPLPR